MYQKPKINALPSLFDTRSLRSIDDFDATSVCLSYHVKDCSSMSAT